MALLTAVAPATVASPARAGATSPPKAEVLKQVLAQGGQQCIATLRRWAHDKRQYRGQVFTIEEVEEAVAAFQAQSRATPGPKKPLSPVQQSPVQQVEKPAESAAEKSESGWSGGLRVTLRAGRAWPWPSTLDAAKLVAKQLGPCHEDLKVNGELIRSLFKAPGQGACHPDVVLVGRGHPVRIGAHKAILASFSDFFRAKFQSHFRDASDELLELTSGPEVLRAAMEFLYTGSCEIDVAALGEMCVMADFWQAPSLAEAASKCWYILPMVHQLEVLSNLDETSAVPKAMVGSLVESLCTSFARAAKFDADSSGPSWQLLKELHQWISHTPAASLERLKLWLSLEEDELCGAVEAFMKAAVEAAGRAVDHELRQLLRRRLLKAWLPEAMLRRIVFYFIQNKPAFEEEQVVFWVSWCYSGGFRCETLLELYEAISNSTMERAPLVTPVGRPHSTAAVSEEDERHITRRLEGLKHSFGLALAEQSYISDESHFWQRWTPGLVPDAMLQHAAQCLGFAALHGRPFPQLSPATVRAALTEAFSKAEVCTVAVHGPKAVAGLYHRKGEKYQSQKGQEALELLYTDRGRKDDNKLNIIWKGIPAAEYNKAKGIWSIQVAGSDELTPPLALLLSRSTPWGPVRSQWWLAGHDGRFQPEPSMLVEVDAISDNEASKLKESLQYQELPQLLEVLQLGAARKLCEAVLRERRNEASQSKVAEDPSASRPRPSREEDQSDWQEAAKVFDAAAAQLCQILQELQGADASIRRRLLAKKRRLESEDDFVKAVKRLESGQECASGEKDSEIS